MSLFPVKGHGRVERRTIVTTTGLNEFVRKLGWGSVHQVIQLTRERTQWNRGKGVRETTRDVAYAIPSLTRTQANPRELVEMTRGHWGIENRLHWVGDETFGEDRWSPRCGPAAVRNAATSALRLEGFDNLAEALRNFGRNSRRALAWLGILKE